MARRKRHGGAFKTRVVVEAIEGHETVNEIASAYEIHPSQLAKWKSPSWPPRRSVFGKCTEKAHSQILDSRVGGQRSVLVNRAGIKP